MLRLEEIKDVAGRDVYDREDNKIGTAANLFLDRETREPEWLGVQTGLFGMKESFVPLQDAQLREDGLHVPFEKSQVKDAPNIEPDAEGIPQEQEQELYSYYGGLGWHPQQPPAGREEGERVGVQEHEMETVSGRLRKYVTTEGRVSTPMEREEVRVEPTTEAGRETTMAEAGPETTTAEAGRETATAGPGITETEPLVTPQEARPTAGTVTEPTMAEAGEAGRETTMAGPGITETEPLVTPQEARPTAGTVTEPTEPVSMGTEPVGTAEEPVGMGKEPMGTAEEPVGMAKEPVTEEKTTGGEVRTERIQAEAPEEGRTEER